jgi:protein phosphatase
MCSDGLHGVVSNGDLETILRAGWAEAPLEQSARKLIEAAKEAGGPDNVTVVLLRKSL